MHGCNLTCFEPDGSKTYDGNVNNCIKDCMKTCGDIQKCQKICINCEVEGQFWDGEEKLLRCPWLNDIKILDNQHRSTSYSEDILVMEKSLLNGRNHLMEDPKSQTILFYIMNLSIRKMESM